MGFKNMKFKKKASYIAKDFTVLSGNTKKFMRIEKFSVRNIDLILWGTKILTITYIQGDPKLAPPPPLKPKLEKP